MILSYNELQLPGDKDLVTRNFYQQFSAFTHVDNSEEKISLFEPAYFRAMKAEASQFQKTRIPLLSSRANEEKAYAQASLDIVYKDAEFHSFVWHTTADKIRLATRYGIVKTYSVTSKVIAALGQYRLITLERARDGYHSNRRREKELLLTHFQERFEKLQVLESLANQSASVSEIERALKDYEAYLNKYAVEHTKKSNTLFLAINFGMTDELKAIKDYRASLSQHAEGVNQATGAASILTLVKTQMIRSLKVMQNCNQKLSYSPRWHFAATRGDLNSCIVDAERVIHEHLADPHNPMSDRHHGLYGNSETLVAYRSTEQGLSPDEEQRALLAISFIEGLQHTDALRLKTVAATKWAASNSMVVSMKRAAAFCVRLVFGLVDLALAVLTRPLFWLGYKKPSDVLTRLATYEIEPVPHRLSKTLHEIEHKAHRRMPSLRSRVGDYLYWGLNHLRDLYRGLRDIGKKITLGLYFSIKNDAFVGEKHVMPLTELLKLAKKEIADIASYENQRIESLTNHKPVKIFLKSTELHAVPEFIPSAGERDDIVNAVTRGNDIFLGFFWHHLYAKHPFTGLVFTGAYAIGGLSVLIPNAMSFLGSFVGVSQSLAGAMANGQLSGAFASGFTLAKGTAGLVESVLHGPKSWAVTGLKEAEKDPVVAVIYAGAAISLGYVLSYELDIPLFSDYLKEDIGSVWPVAAGLVGAKLAVLLFELFYFEDQSERAAAEAVNERIRTLLTESYEHANPDASAVAIRQKVYQAIAHLKDTVKATELRNRYKAFELVKFMHHNKAHLPYLSEASKNQMLGTLKQYYSPQEVRSLRACFYPEKPKSILRTTLNIIGSYPVSLIRTVAAVVMSIRLGNARPLANAYRDFVFQVKKDLTRLLQAVTTVVKSVCSAFRIVTKSLADVLVNSLIARPIALLTDRHGVSDLSYGVSSRTDMAYEKSRQFFSQYTDKATRAVTTPHAQTTFQRTQRASHQFIQASLAAKWDGVDTQASLATTQVSIVSKVPDTDSVSKPHSWEDYSVSSLLVREPAPMSHGNELLKVSAKV